MKYIFKCSDYDIEKLSTQLSIVLDNRIEDYSRAKLPKLWNITDRLNNAPKVSKEIREKRRKRYKFYGVLYIAMGIFLAVPGFMSPNELKVPLFFGLALIVLGLLQLIPRKSAKDKNLATAYKILTSSQSNLEQTKCASLYYCENEIVDEKENIRKYEEVERVYITDDAYFFLWDKEILISQKKDLQNDGTDNFTSFLRNRFADKVVEV